MHHTRFVRAVLAAAFVIVAVPVAAAQSSSSPQSSGLFVSSGPAGPPPASGSPVEDGSPSAEDADEVRRLAEMVPGYREETPRGTVVVRGGETPDPIVNAVEEYRRTGEARTIQQSAYVAYPYGHSQPTLTCAPLRACVIELEANEAVLGIVSGDTERWIIGQTLTGPGGTTPLVVVKPTDHDLTTNLVVTTDRRIYELTLDAPPAPRRGRRSSDENPQGLYTRRIRFYYPDDMIRTFDAQVAAEQAAAEAQERETANRIPMGPDFRLENLNFNYDWQGSERFPFEPEQVFDDGAHTYVKVPASAANEAAPVLFVVEGGERVLVNYAVREASGGALFFITDRVIGQGVLVLGQRRKSWLGQSRHGEETLTIVNLDRKGA
jgi:type IV secretion system protein VirB9